MENNLNNLNNLSLNNLSLNNLNNLILERTNFENEMYDLLVSPLQNIPESFWEPVRISFNFDLLISKYHYTECSICIENKNHFKILTCCNQILCNSCAKKWFELSVICPYCNRDLRNF